jgi:YHS domain-containing protein
MAQVTDPVCGMTIEQSTAAAQSSAEGDTYYFCSVACRELFDADSSKYIAEQHEPRFTKSGGIIAPKFGSAGSGGLEYELLPEAHHGGKKK